MVKSRFTLCGLIALGVLIMVGSAFAVFKAAAAFEAAGGPNLFGYFFKDSNEPGGPAYAWDEISSTGTLVCCFSSFNNGFAGPIPMGFSFRYYQNQYTELYVSTNGYISFGQGYQGGPGVPPYPYPYPDPQNDIMGYAADLFLFDYGGYSQIYYQTLSNPTRFVMEFVNLTDCCYANYPRTFEIVLYENGDIRTQYENVDGNNFPVVGIEGEYDADPLYYGNPVANDLAVLFEFPNTVTLSPPYQTGYALPGDTASYTLSLENLTGQADAFDLQILPGNQWTSTLSITQTSVLSDGESVVIDVWVEVPPQAALGEQDHLTIQATSLISPSVFTAAAAIDTLASDGNMAYVALSYSNLVAIVEPISEQVVGTIDVGVQGCFYPWRVSITPDSSSVYVSCYNSGSVVVIDRATNQIHGQIPGIYGADDIAFTSDGAYALVGSRWNAVVTVVDTASLSQVSWIYLPGYARSLAIHPYLDLAYVTSGDHSLQVIDLNSFSVVTSIPLNGEPWDVEISQDGSWAYVSDRFGPGLEVVSLSQNQVFTTLNLGNLSALEVSPDGSRLYAGGLSNGVYAIDTSTNNVLGSTYAGGTVWEMGLTCDGGKLLVGNVSNVISVVDPMNIQYSGSIDMPGYGSRGIAICAPQPATGAFLVPGLQSGQAGRGEMIAYDETLVNASGGVHTFDLSLGPTAWPTSLSTSQVGPLGDGETVDFTLYVTVPVDAPWYAWDTAIFTATAVDDPLLVDDALAQTQAFRLPEISVSPLVVTSTQFVNQVETTPIWIGNGNSVPADFEISVGTSRRFAVVGGTGSYLFSSLIYDPDLSDLEFTLVGDNFDLSMLQPFDGVIVSEWDQGLTTIESSALLQYFNSGHPVLLGMNYLQFEPFAVQTDVYSIFGITSPQEGNFYPGYANPYHPIGLGVTLYNMCCSTNAYTSNGATWVVRGNDGLDYIFANQTSARSVIFGQSLDYWWFNGNVQLIRNAIRWAAQSGPVDWLSVAPMTGTVDTNSSVWVTATLDSSGVQPGDYHSDIYIAFDLLPQSTFNLPVTMTVLPTADMGQLVGSVEDAWTGQPITATVDLQGVFSMLADPDFSIWATQGSYSLVATSPGYYTVTLPVNIIAGGVTTVTVQMEPAQPRMSVAPSSFSAVLTAGTQGTEVITLTNAGPVGLAYSFHEINPEQPPLTNAPESLPGKRILLDLAHFPYQSTYDYHTVIDALLTAGASIYAAVSPINDDLLADYDVLWVIEGGGYWTYSELSAVDRWLDLGGAVLVQGVLTPATESLPELMGINYLNGYCYYGYTYSILPDPISVGVSSVLYDSCNYLSYGSGAHVVVNDYYDNPHLVAAEQGGGKMVVTSGNDFADYYLSNPDNLLLAMNTFTWLADPGYSDIPWLAVTPLTGVVPGHDLLASQVELDASSLAPGVYEGVIAIEHNDPNLGNPWLVPVQLTVVSPQAGVNLSPALQAKHAEPGEAVVYTYTLTNLGNLLDDFTLEISSTWPATASILSTGPLGAAEAVDFQVQVSIPSGAAFGDEDSLMITAYSGFDPGVSESAEAVTTAQQNPFALLSLSVSSQSQTGALGASVGYTFTLTNLGNVADTYSIQTSGVWTSTLSITSTQSIAPGESIDFTLTVDIPASAVPGSSDLTLVSVHSTYDPLVSAVGQVITQAGRVIYLPVTFRH